MDQVLKLVETMVLERAVNHHTPLAKGNMIVTLLFVVIGVLIVIGLGFLLSALNIYLSSILPIYQVQAILGVCFLTLSVTLIGVIYGLYRMKMRRMAQMKDNIIDNITKGIEFLDTELSNIDFIQDNPKSTWLIAATLGYLVSEKMK